MVSTEKKHFCIHGASSLIGKNFCKYLTYNEYCVTIFAREASDLSFLDGVKNVHIIRYKKSLSELLGVVSPIDSSVFVELSWDGVFGTEKEKPTQFTVNIPQVINSVLLAHELTSAHWIGIGSQAEYGNIDGTIDEMHPCSPMTLYGKAKSVSSTISAELCKVYGIEHSWLRLFSAYGPYGNHKWFIDYLIDEMKKGKKINVTKCEQYLDFLYVDDISKIFIKLSMTTGVGIANLGSGSATQLKEVIEKIRYILRSKSVINYGAIDYKKDQGMFNQANITKISKHTDWVPIVDIDHGLRDMIDKNNCL